MTDTAKRLSGPALLTNAAATQYTVPGSTTGIVRHIHVFNNDTGTVNFTFSIGTDAAGTRLYDAFPIAASGVLDWTGFMVVTAAEIIQAFGSVTNKLVLTMSGIEVT